MKTQKPWLEQVTWDLWKYWVWFCGKSQNSNKSGRKHRAALSALSVIPGALGLACSCHGSFGWTFVLMRTNGLHHFLPEHPPLPMHACTHTFPYAHKSACVLQTYGLSRSCCDRQAETIYPHVHPGQLDGRGSIGNLSLYSCCVSNPSLWLSIEGDT